MDDPGSTSDSYVTILRGVITSGHLAGWGGPEVAAYLASMIAERYARADPWLSDVWQLRDKPVGGGMWMRPLTWFGDSDGRRPPGHIRVPFTVRTLIRGFGTLRDGGLIESVRVRRDPRTGAELAGTRTIYTNHFDQLQYPSERRSLRITGSY
jgi:hypothetical protein